MTPRTVEIIKTVVGSLLVLAGTMGFVFPDGSEAAINDVCVAIGSVILLFTKHGLIRKSE